MVDAPALRTGTAFEESRIQHLQVDGERVVAEDGYTYSNGTWSSDDGGRSWRSDPKADDEPASEATIDFGERRASVGTESGFDCQGYDCARLGRRPHRTTAGRGAASSSTSAAESPTAMRPR